MTLGDLIKSLPKKSVNKTVAAISAALFGLFHPFLFFALVVSLVVAWFAVLGIMQVINAVRWLDAEHPAIMGIACIAAVPPLLWLIHNAGN